MTLVWHYSSPTTPAGAGFDTIVANAVQVDPGHALTEAAALGEAAVVGVRVDDPGAAYDFAGMKRWYAIEDACPAGDQLVWTGYINDQEISRGAGSGTLFPRGAGRRWDLQLEEVNAILGFRVVTGADGDRAAETAGARLTWLLASDYLTTVGDNGLVVYPDDAMDATDYRGQTAQDVLSDLAVQTGSLFFAFYDKDAPDEQRISLFFDDPNSLSYVSASRISNQGDADGTTIFAPWEDATLRRSPGRIAAGVYLPYSGGSLYDYDLETSYAFGFRDQVAPMAEVKTPAKAQALVERFLAENSEQDDRIFARITMRAGDLNDIKRGQALQARFGHFPGYTSWTWMRVIRRTFAPPDNRSQAFYDVDLELSPITVAPQGAFSRQVTGVANSGVPILPHATTPGRLLITVVAGYGNTTLFPTGPRFQDGPLLSGEGGPPIPPYPGLAGWTVIAAADTDYSGMNIGGPCLGYGVAPCTAGMFIAVAYRRVGAGEVTDHPVAVSNSNAASNTSVWLWEVDSADDPSGASVELGVPAAGARDTSSPFTSLLPTLAGNVLAAFVWPLSAGHGAIPAPLTSTYLAGTKLQEGDTGNDPLVGKVGADNWVQIASLPTGGAASTQVTVNPAYTSMNWAGVAVALPEGVTLPAIPYPANQVG